MLRWLFFMMYARLFARMSFDFSFFEINNCIVCKGVYGRAREFKCVEVNAWFQRSFLRSCI